MQLFPDLEYAFKHALIHDVAYKMLSPDRQRALHTAALIAGERFYADRTGEKADWLAFHAFRAKIWDRAVTHFRAAASRAIARAANRVAAQHLENALIAVDNLPSQERGRLAIDLRIDLRHALTPLGQVQRTLDHLRTAEQIATELNDRSRLGRLLSFIANCLLLQARYTEALVTGARALNIARELGDRRLELITQLYIVRARLCRGECRPAIEMYQGIIQALDEKRPDDFLNLPVLPGVFARSILAATLAEVGAFPEAAAHAREAVRRADASGQPDSIMWANWGTGLVALIRGDSGEAIRVFDRLLDLCRTHDLDAYASRIMAALGCARARVGQVNEGLLLLEQAVALDTSAEPQVTRSFALTALAEACFLAGDLGKALTIATQVVQRTRALEERSAEAYACWLLAIIQNARADDLEAADSMFQAATAIGNELGLQPLLAHSHLGFGELYERRGCRPDANAHRERGQRLLGALGMKPWFTLGRGNSSGSRPRPTT
jgi:tetratricopeptide (TPR) repeat protein